MKNPEGHRKGPIKLEEIPKREYFTAPEGYFETLPDVIHSRIKKTESLGLSAPTIKMWVYMAAASVSFVFGAYFFYLKSTNTKEPIFSPDRSVVINYLLENGSEVDMMVEDVVEANTLIFPASESHSSSDDVLDAYIDWNDPIIFL